MAKTDIVINLVYSLNKGEKKSIKMYARHSAGEKDYIVLFDLICQGVADKDSLRGEFNRQRPGASFDTTIKYLYKIITDVLLNHRMNKDSHFALYERLLKCRILYEKSLYEECLQQLHKIQYSAQASEDFHVLSLALRLELDVLISIDFGDITEKLLLRKHTKLMEANKTIRNIQEHSSLYELLRYRISRKSNVITRSQRKYLDDLVFSELNILNKMDINIFTISKQHLLFQANYFIGIGDSNQALKSFIELNDLFEKNKHLWANPPIYYLDVLEGVLSSLRSLRKYDEMEYFIKQLNSLLIGYEYANFRMEVLCVLFLYKLHPLLDHGRYEEALALKWNYEEILVGKISQLNINRQAEIILYVSLINYLNKDMKSARKLLSRVVFSSKELAHLAIFRVIRMVNLIYLYETGNMDLLKSESRSLMREIKEYSHNNSMETLFIRFVNTILPITRKKRLALWDSYSKNITMIKKNKVDLKLLNVFDFLSWMESKIKKQPISLIIKQNIENDNTK